MASINGLSTISATSIQNSGQFYLGNNLDTGTAGQVIVSAGSEASASWGTNSATLPNALTMGTNVSLASGNASFDGSVADTLNATGGSTITAGNGISLVGSTVSTNNDGTTINNTGGSGTQNQVIKVPNTLTINGSAYDGSAAVVLTTPDTQLTLAGTAPITIAPAGLVRTIGLDFDDDTIFLDGGELAVDHVPNELTFTGYATGTYDGSSGLSINLVDTNTTYSAGDNLNLSGTTFNLDSSIEGMIDISFKDNGAATTITGSDYPSKPTVCTYLDLTSATNIMPSSSAASAASPFLGTKIQQTYLIKTVSTINTEYSTNFRTSFIAQSANVMIEFRAVIRCDNRVMYGSLYDYNASKFWTTPQTQTRFNYNDETDQDFTALTWWIDGLTPGNTYYVTPYFRTNSNNSYIYGGNSGTANSFAPAIFRVIDGGDNVGVY